MRVRAPESFGITMVGEDGPYTLLFSRYTSSEWEGFFHVRLDALNTKWEMEAAYDEAGEFTLQGMTSLEAEALWGGVFWYILLPWSVLSSHRVLG